MTDLFVDNIYIIFIAVFLLISPLLCYAQNNTSSEVSKIIEQLALPHKIEEAEKELEKLGSQRAVSLLIGVLINKERLAMEKSMPDIEKQLLEGKHNRKIRSNSLSLLKRFLPDDKDLIIPVLIKVLKDPDYDIGREAAKILGDIIPTQDDIIKALVSTLMDQRLDIKVRIKAAESIGKIGKANIPILKESLKYEKDFMIRQAVSQALAKIGEPAKLEFYEMLNDPDGAIVIIASKALIDIGEQNEDIINALAVVLNNRNQGTETRQTSVELFQEIRERIPDDIVSVIISVTKDEDEKLAVSAVRGLGTIKMKSGEREEVIVNTLIDVLKFSNNWDMRLAAAESLDKIYCREGTDDYIKNSVLNVLLKEALKDPDRLVRGIAVRNLKWIVQDKKKEKAKVQDTVINGLVVALNDEDRIIQIDAARALGKIDTATDEVILSLKEILQDPSKDTTLRCEAAKSLSSLRPLKEERVQHLIGCLNDKDESVQISTAQAISVIAGILRDTKQTGAIKNLKEAANLMHNNPIEEVRHHAEAVEQAADYLESLRWTQRIRYSMTLFKAQPWLAMFPLYLLWTFTILLIYRFSPLYILRIANTLQSTRARLPSMLGAFGISIQYLSLIEFLKFKNRVLDDWVAHQLDNARERFEKMETVKQHNIHIPIPVRLDEEKRERLSARELKPMFDTNQTCCLLIWGEGGTGKTNLACEIARWAMKQEYTERLCKHVMLPIIIDQELDEKSKEPLFDAISGRLHELIGRTEQVPRELIQALMQNRRLLIIIDHLSEMTEKSRDFIKPGTANFPGCSFIVTSRAKESLFGIVRTEIEPLKFERRDQLSNFVEEYLRRLNYEDIFDDSEFFNACNQISTMVGNRKITVLLVKLYIDLMIHNKDGGEQRDLPHTIPDVMVEYVNRLNETIAETDRQENRLVRQFATAVAWTCLKHTYRPSAVSRIDILTAVDTERPEADINYLEKRLRLIKVIGPTEEHVTFLIDPLAEYLAGHYLVSNYQDEKEKWHNFFKDAEKMPGGPKATRGFLQAVYDCCKVYGEENNIPDFVIPELKRCLMENS